MKGIILLSHGPMAKGVYETVQWFFGKEIEQLDYLCLKEDDQQLQFMQSIADKIAGVDSGEGVIVFADLYGGTPCNSCIDLLNDKTELIAGMNLTIILELLGDRLSGKYDMEKLLEMGRQGLVQVKKHEVDMRDDFFD